MGQTSRQLSEIFDRLFSHFGPQGWWPGETPFEVCVGAILTQNTAWANVEKAIVNLKSAGLLDLDSLAAAPQGRVAELIRPSGYFNIKARRLKNFIAAVKREHGNLAALARLPTDRLREFLLGISGIGPETADSMALYAFDKPLFVVDAYTKRILLRHGLVDADADYFGVQEFFERHLPALDSPETTAAHFNEYHALIVMLGKNFCRKSRPLCLECPLKTFNGGPQLPGMSF